MKHKFASVSVFALVVVAVVAVVLTEQRAHSSASGDGSGAGASSGGANGGGAISRVRQAEVTDPQYQVTALTLDVPDSWRFGGTVARPSGCHAGTPAVKYTMQSADGQFAIVQLPGVQWQWTTNTMKERFMAAQGCPSIDIRTAADFVINIAVPNLHQNAHVVSVGPLLPPGQAALASQLQNAQQQNAEMAARYGAQPQKLILEGARVRIRYEHEGKPVDELLVAVINCVESKMPGLPNQPAFQDRNCSSRGTHIVRAPQGQLDAFLAQPQFSSLDKSQKSNPDWENLLMRDQQAAFQRNQAESDRKFQDLLRQGRLANDALLANGRRQDAERQRETDSALAQDRAKSAAMSASAHQTALYSLDRGDFVNPSTGQKIEASSNYYHQWMSSDGSTLVQTNDHSYDPNGQTYINQSWTELVPK